MDQNLIRNYQNRYREYLTKDIIPFWLNNGMDPENGGLFTCLNRAGVLYNTDKSVWFQGRFAWILAKMCNTYGIDPSWQEACVSCLDFLNDYCIDSDGRMFFSVTCDGKPLRKRRYFFSEAFYTIALAEASKAFSDKSLIEKARRFYDFLIDIYHHPENDPYKITPKVISSTRSSRAFANPMILLNVTHIMLECDPIYHGKYLYEARVLTDDIFRYSFQKEFGVFLESTGLNGEFQRDVTGGRTVNPGHTIEGVWFLINQALLTNDNALLQQSEAIFAKALHYGWDDEFGGIYAFGDVTGAPPEALEHDMKLWWPMTELMIASLSLYHTTGKAEYWDWFVRADDYFFSHFDDPKYGECFGYLRREGHPTEPAPKGNLFKGPFHIPRMLILNEQLLGKIAEKRI